MSQENPGPVDPEVATTQAEAKTAEKKPMPPWLRWVVGAAVVLALLATVILAGNLRTARMDRERFQQGVDALAGSVQRPLLDYREPLTESNRAKLNELVSAVQDEADYETVVLTNREGRVIATTDRRLEGEVMTDVVEHIEAIEERMQEDPEAGAAHVREVDGNWRAVKGIWLGTNNPIGGLVVEDDR
jgi:hypothetical protein